MDKIFAAIKAGALGYLLKDSGPEELVEAIHQVHSGNAMLHPAIARKLLEELSFNAPALGGQEVTIDAGMVRETLAEICKDQDLSKFIL